MWTVLFSLLLSLTSLSQEMNPTLKERPIELRAKPNLLFGKSEKTGSPFYDVVITNQPSNGVLFTLPYTKKGGRFSFDLHHRLSLSADFALPAEVTTVVEVLTGGTTSLGTFTISDVVKPGQTYDDAIIKTSNAAVDKYVTPFSTKTVTLDTIPGPQSLSIVGQSLTITRGKDTLRIDTIPPALELRPFRTSSLKRSSNRIH
jgi:hypothetical protein